MNPKSFLGQGWAFPPTFIREVNSVVLSAEDKNIEENLHILFSTQQGERIMNFTYGTILRTLVFEDPDGDLYNSIQDSIRNALIRSEPRIKVHDVQVSQDPGDSSTLLINVQYVVRSTNNRKNFVHPFHIIEGTNIER